MKMKMKKDQFDISDGNLKVLETIPKLMTIPKYRDQLRAMTLDYLHNGTKIDMMKILNKAMKTPKGMKSKIIKDMAEFRDMKEDVRSMEELKDGRFRAYYKP